MEADDLKRLQDGLAEFAALDDASLAQLSSMGPKRRVKVKPPPRPKVSEFKTTADASEKTTVKSKAGAKERELLRTNDASLADDAAQALLKSGVPVIVKQIAVQRPPAIPWTPRTQTPDPLTIPVCPMSLREIKERDRDMSVYDKRALAYELFCGCCGRPVWDSGKTARNSKGEGTQCPECGFRSVFYNYLKKRADLAKWRAENPQAIARSRENNKKNMFKNHQDKQLSTRAVQDLIDSRVAELAEDILKPYIEGIQLEPNPDWSEMTKLEFYLNQTQIADKMLDRSIGKAVQRNRVVNHDDQDVIRDDELSPEVVARMVAAIATGSASNDDIEIEDAEVIEDDEEA